MNHCPKCAHVLTGKSSEKYLGYCQPCDSDVFIKLKKRNEPLRTSMLELHLEYLTKRVKELELHGGANKG